MARKLKTYICRLKEVTLSEWVKNGTGLQNKVEGETPEAGSSYTVAVNTKTLTALMTMPALTGEIPVKLKFYVYGKAGSAAKDIEVRVPGVETIFLELTTSGWRSSAVNNVEGKRVEEISEIIAKSVKAAGGEVQAMYIELTTETERNFTNGSLSRQQKTTSSAGGVLVNSQGEGATVGNIMAGVTNLLFVTVAGEHGATTVTDVGGNTWTLDGEEHRGAATTVQIWSTNAIKALTGTEAITLSGLPPSTKINVAAMSTLTTMAATSKVSALAGGNANGTEVNLEATTRPTQGDFAVLHYGTNISTTFSPSGFLASAPNTVSQEGLTMAPGFVHKPGENETIKAKGTFGASGEIAAILVIYKVVASEAVASQPLAMML